MQLKSPAMKIINVDKETTFYLEPTNYEDTTYNVTSKLVIYDYNLNTSSNIIINLLEPNSEVEYHYSSINEDNNKLSITINHLVNNTISNIYNHVINLLDNEFILDVSGVVKKTSSKCICNQENIIINLRDGKGKILPNLLIDNYDVISSHSAYIGSFKEESIYYLMSRGINKNKCIELLTKSFLVNNGNIDNIVVTNYIKSLGDING